MSLADGIVIEVVCGCDLDASTAELRIDIVVRNDWNFAFHQWERYGFPDQRLIAFIVGMDCDRGVPQHCFRPCRGNDDKFIAIGNRITKMPQESIFFLCSHFKIGDGREQYRVPVHQALPSEYQTIFIETYKYFSHRVRQVLIHGKTLFAPVDRCSQPSELVGNGSAGIGFPFPHFLSECFAPQINPGHTLRIEQALDYHLSRDPGMIGPDLPQCVVSLHPVITNQCIH